MAKEKQIKTEIENKEISQDVNKDINEKIIQELEAEKEQASMQVKTQTKRTFNREASEKRFNLIRQSLIKYLSTMTFNMKNNFFVNRLNEIYNNRDYLNAVKTIRCDKNDVSNAMIDVLKTQFNIREQANNMFHSNDPQKAYALSIEYQELIEKHTKQMTELAKDFLDLEAKCKAMKTK